VDDELLLREARLNACWTKVGILGRRAKDTQDCIGWVIKPARAAARTMLRLDCIEQGADLAELGFILQRNQANCSQYI
jgi:hypothetical protein